MFESTIAPLVLFLMEQRMTQNFIHSMRSTIRHSLSFLTFLLRKIKNWHFKMLAFSLSVVKQVSSHQDKIQDHKMLSQFLLIFRKIEIYTTLFIKTFVRMVITRFLLMFKIKILLPILWFPNLFLQHKEDKQIESY